MTLFSGNVAFEAASTYKKEVCVAHIERNDLINAALFFPDLNRAVPWRWFSNERPHGDKATIEASIMTNKGLDLEYEAFQKALGRRIREFRKERKLSLRDMVVKHGYHDSQWRRFERGGAANVQSLLRIAKALGTSLSILLDGLGEYSEEALDQMKAPETAQKGTTGKLTE